MTLNWGKTSRVSVLLLALASFGVFVGNAGAAGNMPASPKASLESQRLTLSGKAFLHRLVESGNLPDLHWPNFPNYRDEVRDFYDAFDGQLPWIENGKPTPQARAIIALLENAENKGLRPEDYDASMWNERLTQLAESPEPPESDLVRFDLALTVSSMRYVSDLHNGRVNPRIFHFDLRIDHTKFDLSDFLAQKLISSQNVEATLEAAEPPFPVYRRTETALKTYLELARRDVPERLPVPHGIVKPGDSYAGVPRLAKLLALLGDLSSEYSYTGDVYQGPLVDGVRYFQARHGLAPNGLLDAPTLRELNIPLRQRVAQLELTMERLRWLPHEFSRPPVVVNIPEFRLHTDDAAYHWVLSMKVVVGKAYRHETPVFASEITSVIFRPYWDVPSSIVLAELMPHLEKNPSYFSENSYEIVDRSGRVVSEGPVSEEMKEQLSAGKLRVRQKPGPENSLGLVKFEVPSPYAVYLHDTPATQLFARSRRDFSHGCIRVENPVALAEWVLRGEDGWTEDSIRAAMNGEETIQVELDKPIPVLIVYGTAVVMEDGEVHFFDDIYGLDAALEQTLAEGYPYSSESQAPAP